jgi:hypothetical protein
LESPGKKTEPELQRTAKPVNALCTSKFNGTKGTQTIILVLKIMIGVAIERRFEIQGQRQQKATNLGYIPQG